jgi:hypothetical protein
MTIKVPLMLNGNCEQYGDCISISAAEASGAELPVPPHDAHTTPRISMQIIRFLMFASSL